MIDSTVQAAIIQGGLGALFGGGGIAALFKHLSRRQERAKSVAEARCEKICMSLTTGMDNMITMLEVVGPQNPHPAYTHALINLRGQVKSAKDYLGID